MSLSVPRVGESRLTRFSVMDRLSIPDTCEISRDSNEWRYENIPCKIKGADPLWCRFSLCWCNVLDAYSIICKLQSMLAVKRVN